MEKTNGITNAVQPAQECSPVRFTQVFYELRTAQIQMVTTNNAPISLRTKNSNQHIIENKNQPI